MVFYAVVHPSTGYTRIGEEVPDGTFHPQLFYLTVAGSWQVPDLPLLLLLSMFLPSQSQTQQRNWMEWYLRAKVNRRTQPGNQICLNLMLILQVFNYTHCIKTEHLHRWFLSTERALSCDVYKDLDECKTKILPRESKYGLYNREAATLYHCNCTGR